MNNMKEPEFPKNTLWTASHRELCIECEKLKNGSFLDKILKNCCKCNFIRNIK